MNATRPRVWFLNRSYWPDSEATGQLLTELCEDLAGEFEIEVFAGRPNHVEGGESVPPAGPQSRRGVTIRRLWHTRFAKSSLAGKLANLTSFTFAAFLATLFRRRPDLVVTETDPFFLPLLGRWLRWRYGCEFIVWMQDVYPDIAVAVGKAREGRLTRFLRGRLVRAYQRAQRVVVLSDDMQTRLARHGVDRDRLTIIHNWADCRRIQPLKVQNPFRREHGLEDRFVVMYSGNLGLSHWLEPLIAAAAALRDDARFVFLFIGEGVQKPRLQSRAAELGLANVRFLPYQPRELLDRSLSAADVHVVSMRPEARGCVMPSKLYGILASGTPVLSLCPADSDVSRIVFEHNLGEVVDDERDPAAALVDALRRMSQRPELARERGARARQLAVECFDRRDQVERFAAVMRSVLDVTAIGPGHADQPPLSDPKPAAQRPQPAEVLAN